jgi:hypothetical protein
MEMRRGVKEKKGRSYRREHNETTFHYKNRQGGWMDAERIVTGVSFIDARRRRMENIVLRCGHGEGDKFLLEESGGMLRRMMRV